MRSTKLEAAEKTSSKRNNELYSKIIQLNRKVCSDQTGRFPAASSKGNKRVMVVYDHDSNAVLAKPLKSKAALERLKAVQEIHAHSNQKGVCPKTRAMDNECSALVKNCVENEQKIELLLAPPNARRINTAEKF